MIHLLALTASLAFASSHPVQQMNCFPLDVDTTDRAVFSFVLPQDENALPEQGTLFLSSGIDAGGEQESTGILPLKFHERMSATTVSYVTLSDSAEFTLELDPSVFRKNLTDVKVRLSMRNKGSRHSADLELTCYSNVIAPQN